MSILCALRAVSAVPRQNSFVLSTYWLYSLLQVGLFSCNYLRKSKFGSIWKFCCNLFLQSGFTELLGWMLSLSLKSWYHRIKKSDSGEVLQCQENSEFGSKGSLRFVSVARSPWGRRRRGWWEGRWHFPSKCYFYFKNLRSGVYEQRDVYLNKHWPFNSFIFYFIMLGLFHTLALWYQTFL